MISSTYNTLKNFIYSNKYELGLIIAQATLGSCFTIPGIKGEDESVQKIKLARLIIQAPHRANSGVKDLTEKIQCVWKEVSADPEKFIVTERWKLVLRAGVRVFPLLVYVALFAKEIGFSRRNTIFCALTPAFSRIIIAFADQANIPKNLLERLKKIDVVVHVIFEVLTEICIILRKIPESQDAKNGNIFHRFCFSVYCIDLGLTKVIDFVGNHSLFTDFPFITGFAKSIYFGRIQQWTDYFNLKKRWPFWVNTAFTIYKVFRNVLDREVIERGKVWSLFQILSRQRFDLHPQQDNYVWLATAYQDLENYNNLSTLLQHSWKHLTKETEVAFAKKVLKQQLIVSFIYCTFCFHASCK